MRIKLDRRPFRSHRSPGRSRLLPLFAVAILAAPALVLASHQFTDVPDTHPFHDHIDAIADAGVTAGCGSGKYCPDAFVTRGQVAAFLNRLGALGPGQTPVVDADSVDGLDSTAFMPADSAAVMPAATYVTSNEGTVPAGETGGGNASCDPGDRMLSGGHWDVGLFTHVADDHPYNTELWQVFALNQGLEDDTITIYVLCADFPPAHEFDLTSDPAPQRDGGQ